MEIAQLIRDFAKEKGREGRISGLMPHPERDQFSRQDPRFHRGAASTRARTSTMTCVSTTCPASASAATNTPSLGRQWQPGR